MGVWRLWVVLAVLVLWVVQVGAGPVRRLVVATTTSLYDTGLWDYLEEEFERRYPVELYVISAGTGIALKYAQRGDADVVLVHDRAREDEFLRRGYGVARRCVAYNYFLLVGPPSDPAGVKGLSPEEAFRRVLQQGRRHPGVVRFVSRGDNSGTHAREKAIWRRVGFDYEEVRRSGGWYVESGRGMGATLMMASELSAYTLTDMGTFLAFRGKLDLVPLVEKGKALLNIYGVMAVNPRRHPHVDYEMAKNLINFLISEEGQRLIGRFGVDRYGRPLFYPLGGGRCRAFGCPTWRECSQPVR